MKENKTEIIETIVQILEKKVVFAYLYGSVITGRIQHESDIDIGVFLKKANPTLEDRLNIISELTRDIHRKVDLVLLNLCDPIIAMQILSNGQLIINQDNTQRIQYIVKKLNEYADLKISRKIIEDHLLNGRIYA